MHHTGTANVVTVVRWSLPLDPLPDSRAANNTREGTNCESIAQEEYDPLDAATRAGVDPRYF
jgi:hypothetical protein